MEGIMVQRLINMAEKIRERPIKFVGLAVGFSLFMALIDAFIDYLFYVDEPFIEVLIPTMGSHEFYMRSMLVLTYLVFGFLVVIFLKYILQYEDRLEQSELKFRTFANHTNDWEYWINPQNKFVFISPSCKSITGYDEEEFRNNPNLLYDIIHKDDLSAFRKHEEVRPDNMILGDLVFRIKKKSGESVWIEHSCKPIYNKKKNTYSGQRVTNRDITDRMKIQKDKERLANDLLELNQSLEDEVKRRAKRAKMIFNQSPYPQVILSNEGDILDTNPAWDRVFGTSDEGVNTKHFFDLEEFNKNELKSIFTNVKQNLNPVKNISVYFESVDKMFKIDSFPIIQDKKLIQIACNFEDITDRIKREECAAQLQYQRELVSKIFQSIEDERKRLSLELHDQIGQKILLSKLNMEMIKNGDVDVSEKSKEVIEQLSLINKEIRNIIYSLHPVELEKYGLVESLEIMISNFAQLAHFESFANIHGAYVELNKDIELGIYRICQEAFNNIIKHANAKKVTTDFYFNENLISVIISDDGVGFDLEKFNYSKVTNKNYGLASMMERANVLGGNLEIESTIGKGTKVHFEIPTINYAFKEN